MPTPIEILLDPISLIIIAMYTGLIFWEALFPARELPSVKHWKLKGTISFAFFFYLSSYLPLMTDPFLGQYQLLDFSGIGTLGGALFGILLYELALYAWHKSMHKSDFLWKTFHQMHHSAERTDTYGAFFFSPMDMIGFTLMGSVCFAFLTGLSPEAITIVLLTTNFLAIFQHANIKTPQWLGYIVQRPESHAYHHARGIHKHNYSDLPVFDILFGTFTNPKNYEHKAGFYNGASSLIKDMLIFKDVSVQTERDPKVINLVDPENTHDQEELKNVV
jgi:sterol desaturase/sphingolipid hydroxylase (fatty acid hydroxylase superfamily)